MVHVHGAALADRRRVDAGRVVAKVRRDLEGDGDGALGREVVLEGVLVAFRDVDAAARDDDADAGARGQRRRRAGGGVEGAGLVDALVGVVELRREAAGVLDVLEGVGGEAPGAALGVERAGAVDELLLGEPRRAPGVLLEREVALEGPDRREGPAAPAVALVLHLGDDAARPPVERRREVRGARARADAPRRGALLRVHEHRRLELVLRHVAELVQAHPPGELPRVVRLDAPLRRQKVPLALRVLGSRRVALPKGGLILVEVAHIRGRGTQKEHGQRRHCAEGKGSF